MLRTNCVRVAPQQHAGARIYTNDYRDYANKEGGMTQISHATASDQGAVSGREQLQTVTASEHGSPEGRAMLALDENAEVDAPADTSEEAVEAWRSEGLIVTSLYGLRRMFSIDMQRPR